MKRQDLKGLRGPAIDILPPAFDLELVSEFFSNEHTDDHTHSDGHTHDHDQVLGDTSDTSRKMNHERAAEQAMPEAAGNAQAALERAQERAAVDLEDRAKPFDLFAQEDEALTDAAAKPSWAGGGDKTETDDGTSTKGNGNGKGKKSNDTSTDGGDTTPDTGDTTTGTGDTTADAGDTGTNTGDTGTDTGSTPTETNTGSTDPNVYVSGLDTPEGYNISLIFQGTWLDSQRDALARAAETISDFITGDLPNHNGVDDLELTIIKKDIDGAGGAWATGGPRSLRSDTYLPSTGVLTFDTSDEGSLDSSGLWEDLGLHEMMHAMGFGTVFSALGLVETIDGQKRFTGTNAIEAYNTEFATKAANDPYSDLGVQLDSSGAHWHDGTFTTELLTPYLRYSGNYLSDMSIAAMEDIGYETIYESVTIA